MKKQFRFLVSAAVASVVIGGVLPAFAADDAAALKLGKELFMKKDDKKNSCNTCHPKGGSDGSIIEGKKVPNLKKTVGKMTPEKVAEHVKKESTTHAKFNFSAEELDALTKFVIKLGGK